MLVLLQLSGALNSYNLRPGQHDRQLTRKPLHISDRLFIFRMLYTKKNSFYYLPRLLFIASISCVPLK